MELFQQTPQMQPLSTPIAALQSFSRKASIAVSAIGCIVILGWILNIQLLQSILPGLPSMKVNTATCLILGGFSLFLQQRRSAKLTTITTKKIDKYLIVSCSFLILLISLLTLIQYSFDLDLGIDRLLLDDIHTSLSQSAPGRMAPNTAAAFLFVGSALLLLSRKRPLYVPAQVLSLVAFLIGFMSLIGYVYAKAWFYSFGTSTGMALHTSAAFMLLSTGILFASPDKGLIAVISSDRAGGIMARRLFGPAIVLPPLVGYFVLSGERLQIYNSEIGISLLCVLNATIFAVLIGWNAKMLCTADRKRYRAELALKKAKTDLEKRVEERTLELELVNQQLQQQIIESQDTKQALHKNYNLLLTVINSTPAALFVKDIEGRYMMINAAGANIIGKSFEEIIGQDDRELFAPEIADKIVETDRKTMTAGKTQIIEEEIPVQGNLRTFMSTKSAYRDAQGKIGGIVSIARDITDRKQAEVANRSLAAILEATPDFVGICDIEGRAVYINKAGRKMLGIDENEDISHRQVAEFSAASARSTLQIAIATAVSGGVWSGETAFLSASGLEIPVSQVIISHEAPDGQLAYISTIARDISDRVQVLETLKQSVGQYRSQAAQLEKAVCDLHETQTQLIQTEKISSLGQLVAGVAHEINNPINFIYGNITHATQSARDLLELLQLYQQNYPNPVLEITELAEEIEIDFLIKDFPKILESMKVGADRIRDLVVSLRNFSRLDEAQMKRVDIHEGIDSTLLILQHRLKATDSRPAIQIIKEYGNFPKIECYAGQLNQVFMNIIANAIDALEEYNTKRSSKEIYACPNTITISTTTVNSHTLSIRIADNGPGMNQQVIRNLFDPFFTTKPVGKGTGLGLSISYQIVVEKHRGKLQCFSVSGAGAEFAIEIPISQQLSPPVSENNQLAVVGS